MRGRSEGSEDKGEVCMRWVGVGGVGWGLQKSGNPHITHVATHNKCNNLPYLHTHTSSSSSRLALNKGVGQDPGVAWVLFRRPRNYRKGGLARPTPENPGVSGSWVPWP